MADYKTPIDALAEALYLAVTAPSEEKSKMAVKLGEKLAAGLSEVEVARAKKIAQDRLNEPPFM